MAFSRYNYPIARSAIKEMKGIKFSFGKTSYIGVDVGTTSIKAAEISSVGGKYTLLNYGSIGLTGYLDRPNNVIQTSSLRISDVETAKLLKMLVEKMGLKDKTAVAMLPAFSAFTSLVTIPLMSIKETAQAIPFQARTVIPVSMSEVAIDWISVGEFEDAKGIRMQKIFIIGVPNDNLAVYQSLFKKAGMNLKMAEIEAMSLARSLTKKEDADVLILDIGALSSSITIAGQGMPKYAAQTDFAGNSLTQALTKGLGINIRRAEALKRQRGLSGMGGEYGLSTLMLPFLDVILNEVRRAKAIYEDEYLGKVTKILLIGGGSELPGLKDYMSSQFDIPVEKANPFDKVAFDPRIASIVPLLSGNFSGSIGAGMKESD